MPVKVMDSTLDSVLESVDTVEDAALEAGRELGFGEDDLARIGIAVREAVVNAVVHGNGSNPRKKVRVAISSGGGSLAIEVRDEGNGFDPCAVPDPLAEPQLLRGSGRGVLLMRASMDEVTFGCANGGGTLVRLVKHLPRK